MALSVPTIRQVFDLNLANIEAKTGQSTPANDRAYNRVIAQNEAGNFTTLYKFALYRVKQVLALTAIEGLDDLMRNYGLTPKSAVKAVLTATIPAVVGSGAQINSSDYFVGDANGVIYYPDATYTEVAGVITLSLTASTAGVIGNLSPSTPDTLTIGHVKPGIETAATVTGVTTTGAEAETSDAKRVRLLDKIRAPGGGGDSADYRNWAQQTPGVFRAFPFAGNPTYLETGAGSIYPGERTVYIECDASIDADGIPPAYLLDDARDYITTDLDTGRARQPLPLIDSDLYVEPIIRTEFYVEITGLSVSADVEVQTKADITTALTAYFSAIIPYIDGLDFIGDKNDIVTVPTITKEVQSVVSSAGGTFTSLRFNIGAGFIPSYQVGANELGKLASGGVSYV